MSQTLYDTRHWRKFRESVRADETECALSVLAGPCQGDLHVHHIKPLAEGGELFPTEDGVAVLCARHHRMLHGFLNRQRDWKTCPHTHRSREAREQCERRLNSAA